MIKHYGGIEYLILKKDKWGEYLTPYIAKRVMEENSNMIILFSGKPRTGKSNDCIRLALNLRDHYGCKFPDDCSHIAMGSLDFLNILKTNPPPGSVIIYEEAPVGHNSRQWHSRENEMLNNILNTFGYRRYVYILNGVSFKDLDKQARKLIYMHIKVLGKSMRGGVSYGQAHWLDWDDYRDDFFKTVPRTVDGDMIKRFNFTKVPHDIWKLYESKKFAWNDRKLNEYIKESELTREAMTKHVTEWKYDEVKMNVMQNPDKFLTSTGKISLPKLIAKYDMKRSIAVKVKAKLELEDIDWKLHRKKVKKQEIIQDLKNKPDFIQQYTYKSGKFPKDKEDLQYGNNVSDKTEDKEPRLWTMEEA